MNTNETLGWRFGLPLMMIVLLARFLSGTALAAEARPVARAEDVGMSADRFATLRSTFDGYVTRGELSGAVILVMRRGGELDGARVFSPKTVELMTTHHVGDEYGAGAGVGFGLGFRVVLDVGATGQPGSAGEFGWGGAYHSTYWVDPAEELVVA